MCRSMADIRSTAAEIRRGKKEEEGKKETTGRKYNGPLLHRAAIINQRDRGREKDSFYCYTRNSRKSIQELIRR